MSRGRLQRGSRRQPFTELRRGATNGTHAVTGGSPNRTGSEYVALSSGAGLSGFGAGVTRSERRRRRRRLRIPLDVVPGGPRQPCSTSTVSVCSVYVTRTLPGASGNAASDTDAIVPEGHWTLARVARERHVVAANGRRGGSTRLGRASGAAGRSGSDCGAAPRHLAARSRRRWRGRRGRRGGVDGVGGVGNTTGTNMSSVSVSRTVTSSPGEAPGLAAAVGRCVDGDVDATAIVATRRATIRGRRRATVAVRRSARTTLDRRQCRRASNRRRFCAGTRSVT